MSKPSSGGSSGAPLSSNPLRQKGFNPLGSLTLILGRSADPIIQYNLLRHGYAGVILENVFRAKRIISLPLVNRITFPGVGLGLAGVGARDYWGANMVDKPGNLLVTMTGIFALRQVYWAIFTNDTAFPVAGGIGVSVYNLILSTINSLVFVHRVSKGKTSPLRSGWMQYVGLVMLIAGVGTEIAAEETRKKFKKQPKNKGKVDDSALFGIVRHPNYLGYTLSRVGMAMATGSWLNVAINAAFQVALFTQWSIPELSGYMQRKYGEQWNAYKQKVPYGLIPGLI